jgi:hypothetical protein
MTLLVMTGPIHAICGYQAGVLFRAPKAPVNRQRLIGMVLVEPIRS